LEENRYLVYINEVTRVACIFDNKKCDSNFLKYIKDILLSEQDIKLKTLYTAKDVSEVKEIYKNNVKHYYILENFMNEYLKDNMNREE
jgi:hypothetical protein